ncbi:hypothetical protein HPNQ4161_0406 [Helicobacter pylori NQ4161]|nr:hypothetical protein HPNQ4161_0406 [Helicobacter pylori NQ4161]
MVKLPFILKINIVAFLDLRMLFIYYIKISLLIPPIDTSPLFLT